MNVYDIKEHRIRILDTQGFGCPRFSDPKLYNSLCLNFFDPKLKARVHQDGLNSIIIPIMITKSARVTNEQVKVIYNHIMMFQLIDAEQEGKPKP
jgi:hypothetical protein